MMEDYSDFKPAIDKVVKRLREASLWGWRVGISWGCDAGEFMIMPSVSHDASGTTYLKKFRFDSRQTADIIRSGTLPEPEVDRMVFGMIEALGQFERWREPDKNDPTFKTTLTYHLLDDKPAGDSPTIIEARP